MNLKNLKKKNPESPTQNTNKKQTRNYAVSTKNTISFSLDDKKLSQKPATKKKHKLSRISKIFLSLFLLVLTIGGSVFGYFYYQNFNTLRNTGVENVGLFDPINYAISAASPEADEPLKNLEKTDGRTNFLLLGVDARRGFSSFRTDSIIIASYNHSTKDVVEFSIPRDMQATYGRSITKINAVFQFSYNDAKARKLSEEDSLKESFKNLSSAVKEVTDIQIHYGIMVNFTALKDIVDALGGITINVTQPLFDNLFPNDSDTGVITINFKTGEQTMNGTRALQYARSRETTSDYDRARRQQEVINAIKTRFINSNIFTDVGRINAILEAISKNVKFFNVSSNVINDVIQSREVLNKISVANVVLDPNIGSQTGQVLRGGEPVAGAGFLVFPTSGNYNDLKEIVKRYLDNPALLREDASVRTVYTNQNRFRDFDRFNKLILDEKMPYVGIYSLIRVATPKTTGTVSPTQTATPTPTNTPKKVSVFWREDKPKTLEYYRNLLNSQNIEVSIKPKEDLPKELEKHFNDSNILIVFD